MRGMFVRTRLWLIAARPPWVAVALGVAVGLVHGSPVVAGAVAAVAVMLMVGWREYRQANPGTRREA